MDVALIITVVLTVITLAVWLFSFLMGFFRDGTAKAFWKFTWAGLAALATFGIVMAMRGAISDSMNQLINAASEGEGASATIVSMIGDIAGGFAGALVAPILFSIIYLPVRWIFLIPQKLLWKHLVSPNLDKLINDETGALKFKGVWGIFWNFGGGVFRVCATIVLTSAVFLGMTGYATTAFDAMRPFVSYVENQAGDDGTKEALDGVYAFTDNFAVRTAAFTYGGLYRSMTSVEISGAKTSIPEMMKTASDAGYHMLTVLEAINNEGLNDQNAIDAADAVFKYISENDFYPAFLATVMNDLAESEELRDALLSEENEQTRDIMMKLLEAMKKADTESVRADLLTLSALTREMAESGILEFVLSDEEGKEFPIKNLMNEERLVRLLMVVYDNSFGRAIVTPVINMALNAGLESLGAEPITLDANIEHMSRSEMEEEAKRLAKIISNLGTVLDSVQGDNVTLGSVNVGALGEAIDLIKDSEILGEKFDLVLDAVGKSETVSGALGEQGGTIIGALKDAPSVEDALVISQSFTVIAEELSKVTENGDVEVDKEAVAGALQGLVNSSSEENNEFILGKVDELFPEGEGTEEAAGAVKEIASAILGAVSDIEEISDEQAAIEADSLLGLYDMVSGKTEVTDNQEAAEEIIDNIAASTVLMKTVENAVESGNDFGLKENLPKETVDKIADVIESAEMTEEQRATLLAFFGK